MEIGQLQEGLLYLKPSGNGFTCSGFASLSEIHLHRRRMFVGQICCWQNLKAKLYDSRYLKGTPNTSRDMATAIEIMLPFIKHVQTTNRRMIHTIYKSKRKLYSSDDTVVKNFGMTLQPKTELMNLSRTCMDTHLASTLLLRILNAWIVLDSKEVDSKKRLTPKRTFRCEIAHQKK